MANRYNPKKAEALKEIHSHVWNLYIHAFNDRRIVEDKLTYLLAINTLFLLGYTDLFKEKILNPGIYIIPFLLLFLSAIILFIQFISKQMSVPWFTKEEITDFLDKGVFYTKSLGEIIACENNSYNYMCEKWRILRICYSLIFFAIVSAILISIIGATHEQLRLFTIGFIFIGSAIVYYLVLKNSKKYYTDDPSRSDRIKEHFEKWLKDEATN
ncbi:hypothetical protein L6303_00200 [archaeon]|nr:hypothetical protein [Nanoarchaeota archaeon]MBU4451631.1 hypothetical protein [Nanoarchaeota archaeon]MCG2723153.1 hypothetical protein [archaeon]